MLLLQVLEAYADDRLNPLLQIIIMIVITRNAWQSLACSPCGIAVTPSSV